MKSEKMHPIVKRIVEECKKKNMNYSELCRRAKMPPTTFSNYLHRGGCPKMDSLNSIAKALSVSVDYLRRGVCQSDNLRSEMEDIISRMVDIPNSDREKVIRLINHIVDEMVVEQSA